jgi:TonB family protein
MTGDLERALARRRSLDHLWFRRWSLTAAISLHLAILIAILVAPLVMAQRRPPIEFVDVQVVPAAALERPRSAPARKPAPEPEPPPPEPEPEPTPVEEDRPKLPSPEAEKEEPKPEPPPPSPETGEATETEDGPTSEQPIAGGDGPAAVLGFDNPDFVYGYYVDRMLAAIRAQWLRPPVGNDVEMIVHFIIRQDGTVEDLEIVKSSQIRSFDLAGQRAVLSAAPLPPLPRSYREPSLGVTLIIR